jgi:peptidoglycan/xylan/chitin deacetylase (PgdA/CDA1 family)
MMSSKPQFPGDPMRRYGMDHDRYDWSLLQKRAPVSWPDGKNIALWVNIAVEEFPMNDDGKPFKLPGTMVKPYPDLQTYTWRDYGNRVGIYRVMRAADKFGIKPDWSVNAAIAEKYPQLLRDILARGEDVIAHGMDMATPHHGGMPEAEERALVQKALRMLHDGGAENIRGWLSPGKSQSALTPEILAEAGMEFLCDWPNDELPYIFRTEAGEIVSMPHSSDLNDRRIIADFRHDEASFVDQVKDHYTYLSREADAEGGRVMSLTLHPWVTGQSHRIAALEEAFSFLSEKADIWFASGAEICSEWKSQTGN